MCIGVCGVLGCNLDFVAGLFLDIVRVCAYDAYVSLLQDNIIIIFIFIIKIDITSNTENTVAVLVIA